MVKFRNDVDYEETVKVLDKTRKISQICVEDYVIEPEDIDENQNLYDILESDDYDIRNEA